MKSGILLFAILLTQIVEARKLPPSERMTQVRGLQSLEVGNETSITPEQIRVGRVSYNGTGCPEGSASVVLSPDQKSLSMIYDQFINEAGAGQAPRVRKNCNMTLQIDVPSKYQVAVVRLDYRGFNSIPERGATQIESKFHFVGERLADPRTAQVRRVADFQGPLNEDFTAVATVQEAWSNCGQMTNLIIQTSMVSDVTRNPQEALFSSLDSIDLTSDSELKFHLKWRHCLSGPSDKDPIIITPPPRPTPFPDEM